ncbi:MAG TPA: hypothetical protein VFF78_00820 [Anaerolineaceae bacterium]|nr:hypothetical protein [Anaerolineaceae bacterium]
MADLQSSIVNHNSPIDDGIEWIKHQGQTLAVVIRAQVTPEKTTFITPNEFLQQAGFVVYPAGGQIAAHTHHPIERHLTGTAETLIVRKGRLNMRLYTQEHVFVAERILESGDIILLVAGGHGFQVLEDAVLFEIKQGPYTGLVEKERFDDPG